jgi:hypothetical protein
MTGTIGKMVSFRIAPTIPPACSDGPVTSWRAGHLDASLCPPGTAHPGAQLTQFEAEEGWRYSLWVINLPASTLLAWLRQLALDGDLAEAEPKRCATTSPTAQISAAWPWQLRS